MDWWTWTLTALAAALGIWALVDYESFWFHTEFFLPPEKRRPYTYLARDLYHQAAGFVVPMLGFGFTAVGIVLATAFPAWKWIILGLLFTGYLFGALTAHLFWGKDYIPGQMPTPKEYQPTQRVRAWRER